MTELLRQGRFSALAASDQVAAIYAGNHNFLDDVEVSDVIAFRDGLVEFLINSRDALRQKICEGRLSDETAAELDTAIDDFKKQFMAAVAAKRRAATLAERQGADVSEEELQEELDLSAPSVPDEGAPAL